MQTQPTHPTQQARLPRVPVEGARTATCQTMVPMVLMQAERLGVCEDLRGQIARGVLACGYVLHV